MHISGIDLNSIAIGACAVPMYALQYNCLYVFKPHSILLVTSLLAETSPLAVTRQTGPPATLCSACRPSSICTTCLHYPSSSIHPT